MKPKLKGWKEGILTQNLQSAGSALANKQIEHKKGDLVRYRQFKEYDVETTIWTGKYEYHYLDLNNTNLVRSKKLLIEE